MKTLKYKTTTAKTLNLEQRQSASKRGYGSDWREASLLFRMYNPLCVECLKKNRSVAAQVVDHIIPHKGDPTLRWDRANWQSLCKSCHSKKTAAQDGGFGNRTLKAIKPKPVNTIIGKTNQ